VIRPLNGRGGENGCRRDFIAEGAGDAVDPLFLTVTQAYILIAGTEPEPAADLPQGAGRRRRRRERILDIFVAEPPEGGDCRGDAIFDVVIGTHSRIRNYRSRICIELRHIYCQSGKQTFEIPSGCNRQRTLVRHAVRKTNPPPVLPPKLVLAKLYRSSAST